MVPSFAPPTTATLQDHEDRGLQFRALKPARIVLPLLSNQVGSAATLHARRFPDHDPAQERDAARSLLAEVALGGDPSDHPTIVDDRRYAACSLRSHVEGARREPLRCRPATPRAETRPQDRPGWPSTAPRRRQVHPGRANRQDLGPADRTISFFRPPPKAAALLDDQ